VEPCAAAEPADAAGAGDDLDIGPRLVEQRRELDRALPGPDDGRSGPGERAQRPQLRGVGDARGAQPVKAGGTAGEPRRPRRDDHPARGEPVAVVEVQVEAAPDTLHPRHAARVDIGDRLALEPASVAEVVLQRDRTGESHSMLGLVVVERELARRIGDRRRLP
jgi:hypothetical protein